MLHLRALREASESTVENVLPASGAGPSQHQALDAQHLNAVLKAGVSGSRSRMSRRASEEEMWRRDPRPGILVKTWMRMPSSLCSLPAASQMIGNHLVEETPIRIDTGAEWTVRHPFLSGLV